MRESYTPLDRQPRTLVRLVHLLLVAAMLGVPAAGRLSAEQDAADVDSYQNGDEKADEMGELPVEPGTHNEEPNTLDISGDGLAVLSVAPADLGDKALKAWIEMLVLGPQASAAQLRERDELVTAINGLQDSVRRRALLERLAEREQVANTKQGVVQ